MTTPNITNEATRAYVYRIIVIAIPLLIALGVAIPSESVGLILELAAAVLAVGGTGLAVRNTSTSADVSKIQ